MAYFELLYKTKCISVKIFEASVSFAENTHENLSAPLCKCLATQRLVRNATFKTSAFLTTHNYCMQSASLKSRATICPGDIVGLLHCLIFLMLEILTGHEEGHQDRNQG